MKLVADESVDFAVVENLRNEGHEVTYIAELSPSISDDEVLRIALEREAVLITADKDFGELIFRLGRAHQGVILIRLAGIPTQTKADIVARALSDHRDNIPGAFSVLSPGSLRIRPRQLSE